MKYRVHQNSYASYTNVKQIVSKNILDKIDDLSWKYLFVKKILYNYFIYKHVKYVR